MNDDRPEVVMDFSMWCPRHLYPLQARWPWGAVAAMVGLLKAAAADDRVIEASGGSAENLSGVLRIVSPVCCFLGDEIAEGIITAALADLPPAR